MLEASGVTPYVSFLGSMIEYPPHHSTLWADHRIAIEDSDIIDPSLQILYHAIVSTTTAQIIPTVDAVANEILLRGEDTNVIENALQEQGVFKSIKEWVTSVAERGVKNKHELARTEAMMHDFIMDRGMKALPEKIQRMVDRAVAPHKISDEVEAYLGRLKGIIGVDTLFADYMQQNEIFDTFADERRKLLNLPLFSFPQDWGMFKIAPTIKPGHIVTITGLSSDGKSSAAHQWAENTARQGYRSLVLHLEDSIDMILMRQCCRWIPKTNFNELECGDPERHMEKMKVVRQEWRNRGGDIDYAYVPSMRADLLTQKIQTKLIEARGQGNPYRLIVVDYVQLVDFDSGVTSGSNRTNVANNFIRSMKALGYMFGCTICFVSQVTQGEAGVNAKDSKELTTQAQYWIHIDRSMIKTEEDEEFVSVDGEKVVLAGVGQRSLFGKMIIKKNTNGSTGIVDTYFNWITFSFMGLKYAEAVKENPRLANEMPMLKAPTKKDAARYRAYELGFSEVLSIKRK